MTSTDHETLPGETNRAALAARPCIQPWFEFGLRRGQDQRFRDLRERYPFVGPVLVEVPGCDHIWMMNRGDDNVCQTFFFFGEGAYETLSTILFGQLAQQTGNILDVGGHTGLYSLIAAKANPGATVHYFEVMPQVAARAAENFEISGVHPRVRQNTVGVSRSVGTMEVHFNENQPMWTGASLENIQQRVSMKGAVAREVPVTSLDAYWAQNGQARMGLMKIDVEDHETEVFEGAAEMLAACQPYILSEILSKEKLRSYTQLLRTKGYAHLYEIDDANLKLRALDPNLKYDTGEAYTFGQYHNVLFSVQPLSRSFCARLADTIGNSRLARNALSVYRPRIPGHG